MARYSCYFVCFYLLLSGVYGQSQYPKITLPWGTWQATDYSKDKKVYIFKDVRFGDQPERFSPSSFPTASVKNTSDGFSCIQIDPTKLRNPPGGQPGYGSPILYDPDTKQSEDCLFLDIYVPKSAFTSGAAKLPVIVWFYGGAFAFGSKELKPDLPLYTGRAMLRSTGYNAIFVAGNYRLGAFGWLAGSYMEKSGLPNAGLYDQALLLQWVHKYISLVQGDNSRVSAWGESAGAGSILHHLIRENGTEDPLFQTALLQSPAFQWQWDNSTDGTLDQVYKTFSSLTECGSAYDITCLRNVSTQDLTQANQQLFKSYPNTGIFPVGPSIDGRWVQTLPAYAFANDLYWKSLSSILVSHVANETANFTPSWTVSQPTFDKFLHNFMPESALDPERDAIRSQYDCTKSPYDGDFRKCTNVLIRDSSFTCNTRQLFNAYPNKAYMMQYSWPGGTPTSYVHSWPNAVHASDLIPAFMNKVKDAYDTISNLTTIKGAEALLVASRLNEVVKTNYQAYLASYALRGDPNGAGGNPNWPAAIASSAGVLQNVMEVRGAQEIRLLPKVHPFGLIEDEQNTHDICSFWTQVAYNITQLKQKLNADPGRLKMQIPQDMEYMEL